MFKPHIFVSYAHDDRRWFEKDSLMPRLIKSLEVLDNAEVWYDRRRLAGGDPWRQEIEDAIDRAHVAILLVSTYFIVSEFIRDVELPRIGARARSGELVVIPILVGHCDWRRLEVLKGPQMIPGEPTPLVEYRESESKWERVQHDILNDIERQINKVRERLEPSQEPARGPTTTFPSMSEARTQPGEVSPAEVEARAAVLFRAMGVPESKIQERIKSLKEKAGEATGASSATAAPTPSTAVPNQPTAEVPGASATCIRVTVFRKGNSLGPNERDLLGAVQTGVEAKLQALGCRTVSFAAEDDGPHGDYDAELEIEYSNYGGLSCTASVLRKDGTVIGSHHHSFGILEGRLEEPVCVAQFTASLVTGDPSLLISLLDSNDRTTRFWAALWLAHFPDRSAVHALTHAMAGGDDRSADSSAYSLAAIAGRARESVAMEPLVRALRDRSWVRRTGAVKKFTYPLEFSDPDSRQGAAWILGELGDKAAVEPLTKLLQSDGDSGVKAAAEDALRKLAGA